MNSFRCQASRTRSLNGIACAVRAGSRDKGVCLAVFLDEGCVLILGKECRKKLPKSLIGDWGETWAAAMGCWCASC